MEQCRGVEVREGGREGRGGEGGGGGGVDADYQMISIQFLLGDLLVFATLPFVVWGIFVVPPPPPPCRLLPMVSVKLKCPEMRKQALSVLIQITSALESSEDVSQTPEILMVPGITLGFLAPLSSSSLLTFYLPSLLSPPVNANDTNYISWTYTQARFFEHMFNEQSVSYSKENEAFSNRELFTVRREWFTSKFGEKSGGFC